MKVKFANGVTKVCSSVTEQKIFKNVGGETVGAGWILFLKLSGETTSSALDDLLTAENVASLEFSATNEETGEETVLFTLTGYDKITSSTIRHSEDSTATYAEIQISKGV